MPIPGSKALNQDRHAYLAFQQELGRGSESVKGKSFLEWWRQWQISKKVPVRDDEDPLDDEPKRWRYDVKRRKVTGPGRNKPFSV